MTTAAELVIALWDPVGLDASGRLTSTASFVRVLEELRAQTPILLLCGGDGGPVAAGNIRVAPLGFVPTFAAWVRNPRAFSDSIRRLLVRELEALSPETPILLVDVSIPNYRAMTALAGRRVFLYLRGDDVREARIRQRGIARIAVKLYAVLLSVLRRRMLERLPLIGAGRQPLPRRVLEGREPWPFYPSSFTRAELAGTTRCSSGRHADRDPVRIVWIGRLAAIKRVDVLIRAAGQFARSWRTGVELHLFGDGPLRGELELLASRVRSPLKTVFHGQVPRPDIIGGLDGALCLALTSAWEGFPKVIAEALSAGVPIVSVDIGSVSSLIETRDVGMVVRGGESDLAGAFCALAGSPDEWLLKSAKAREAALDLALDNQCRLLLEHLRTCPA
jgi:glycosyltransferase involved in cell wall biosynthesis